ncbi:hypothetical protein TNCV_1460001 [Trichonephila clavipes]|nr:hypothetical protein TNCV_1460001 [Trichonephila clavipes]
MWVRRGSLNLMAGKGSSESVQEFTARINKLGTQIFHSSNTAQNTAVRNANDQLLQSRFISGLRNVIRRFVLARDPNNLEESINAALIEEQNVKLNQNANDERTGLSPLQTETPVISALTNKLEEINLRVERLQEASSVTARKTGGGLIRRRETVFKCYYCGLEGHKQAECRKKRMEECTLNYQPPWGNAASEFSVFRHPSTHSFDRRRVHFHDSAFRDNYAAPRHSANVSQSTSRGRGDVTRFRRNTRNGNRDYTGMLVRRGSSNLMAGKVVFLRGLLNPIRVVDLMVTSRSPIIHPTFIELAIYRRQQQKKYSSPFSTAFGSAPYSSKVGPFSCRPSRERSYERPCEGGYKQSCGSGRPHGSYID